MELTFFIRGGFINIPLERGENNVRYSTRVKFILENLERTSLEKLISFSKIYANMVLLGMKYPKEKLSELDTLTGKKLKTEPQVFIEEQKIEEAEERLMDVQDVEELLQGAVVSEVNNERIVTDDGITIVPLGTEAFLHVEGNQKEEVESSFVNSVELKASSEVGETAGLVINFDHPQEVANIEVKSCADPKCEEPAPVLVNSPTTGLNVVIKPLDIESLLKTQQGTNGVEKFGDSEARNSFLLPDFDCYREKEGDQNLSEDEKIKVMTECVELKFQDETSKNKLRSTKDRELLYSPSEENNMTVFWSENNRYGKILMAVRESFKVKKNEDARPQEVCEDFFSMPTDAIKMNSIRKNILDKVGSSDGNIPNFKDTYLVDILNAYDEVMLRGELSKALKSGFKFILSWVESDVTGNLDISGDGKIFSLELSRPIFVSLAGKRVGNHEVFGVSCSSQAECVMIYVESFISTVLHELCHPEESVEELASAAFGHHGGDVKFSPLETSPEVRGDQIRNKLLEIQKKKGLEADTLITIEGLGVVMLINARNREKGVMIKTAPGEGNPTISEEQRHQPFTSVTHVDGVPIAEML